MEVNTFELDRCLSLMHCSWQWHISISSISLSEHYVSNWWIQRRLYCSLLPCHESLRFSSGDTLYYYNLLPGYATMGQWVFASADGALFFEVEQWAAPCQILLASGSCVQWQGIWATDDFWFWGRIITDSGQRKSLQYKQFNEIKQGRHERYTETKINWVWPKINFL